MPATADFFVFICRLAMRAAKFFVIYNSAFAAKMSAWSLFISFFFYHIQLLRRAEGTQARLYLYALFILPNHPITKCTSPERTDQLIVICRCRASR